MKLGKRPAREGVPRLMLRQYVNLSQLPSVPNTDYAAAVRAVLPDWGGVMGNDMWGDCFWAGNVSWIIQQLALDGTLPSMWPDAGLTNSAMNAYAGYLGLDHWPKRDSDEDQGSDPLAGLAWWQKNGIMLPDGTTHKLGSYAWLNPKDHDLLIAAFNIFQGLGVGVKFYKEWFDADQWTVQNAQTFEGGHWVLGDSTLIEASDAGLQIRSWAKEYHISWDAVAKEADEIAVLIGPELFGPDGKTIAGFDAEALQHDEGLLNRFYPK